MAGETLEHALSRLEASGAALAPGFAPFAEACLVKGVTLHVLSRGWKPVVSHFLRSAGLGHVQVSANNLLEQEGKWRFSFRDHSAAGHDKAEALRRAQRDARPAQPEALLVGRFACDLAAVQVEGHADMCMCMMHIHNMCMHNMLCCTAHADDPLTNYLTYLTI